MNTRLWRAGVKTNHISSYSSLESRDRFLFARIVFESHGRAYTCIRTLISLQHLINLNAQINGVDAGIIMPKFAATRQLSNNRYGNNEIRECGVIQSSESNELHESQLNQEHARVSSSMSNTDVTIVQGNNNRKKNTKKNNKKRRSLKYKPMILRSRRMYNKTLVNNTYFNEVHPSFDKDELGTDNSNILDYVVISEEYDSLSKSTSSVSDVPSAIISDIVQQKTINNIDKQNGISKSYNFNIYVENGKVSDIPDSNSCNVSVQNKSQEIRVNTPCFDELSIEEKTNPLFIAIIGDGYPNCEPITNLHFQSLDRAIQMRLENLKDELSKHWIAKHISKIHPWPTAKLKAACMDLMDRAYYRHIAGKTTLFLPNEESAITVLYRLQNENPQLDLASWNISTEEVYKKGHKKGFLIHFGIPFSSLKILESMNFKLFLGMKQVFMNVKLY
ncbi:uncharacterized protein LOC103316247 isoform X2 [Nasonia vitripennis]|uniref:DUF4780 domain-containing protein n=1 Tax=Nasonia vitripennis TaxID=7425 RepID=A0A7M7LUE5_NASVI|nr:uncharacterized protein LOC103316247 isoform X2 [Nasonia vitripennis]